MSSNVSRYTRITGWALIAVLVVGHWVWTHTDPRFVGGSAAAIAAFVLTDQAPPGLAAPRFNRLAGDAK